MSRSLPVALLIAAGLLAACADKRQAAYEASPQINRQADAARPQSTDDRDLALRLLQDPAAPPAEPAEPPARLRPAPGGTPVVFTDEAEAIGRKVLQAWAPPSPGAAAIDAVIQVRVAVDRDGTVLGVRTVDEARMNRDPTYKQWAESLEDAIVRASPLPIPAERYEQFRLMILPFNPRTAFAPPPVAAAAPAAPGPVEMRAVQEHIAPFWYPPRLPRGAKAQDFPVSVRVTVAADGTVSEARTVDQTRMERDPFYRLLADSAERAIRQASPLPLPPQRDGRPRTMLLNFVADDE